ncbi:hypothetical protein IWQ60_007145 [Tieghemiomyces parasiticus]|uniref:Eukaryotic membrane protein family-domain-containing protein n=1 Tax=Tieghemiomyces parasiticus TaxID=78921 RepID=A0A9W8A2W5_9FUNG|nr:hypothetical protein IWQ60_007145 [Tieghemiomyces parasiticus]
MDVLDAPRPTTPVRPKVTTAETSFDPPAVPASAGLPSSPVEPPSSPVEPPSSSVDPPSSPVGPPILNVELLSSPAESASSPIEPPASPVAPHPASSEPHPASNDPPAYPAEQPSPPAELALTPAADSNFLSLWDHVHAELEADGHADTAEVQRERLGNFLRIPRQVEKLMLFGNLVALDAFLHVFTILPARIALALWSVARRPFLPADHVARQRRAWLLPSQRCDLMRGFLVAMCCLMLQGFDSAQLYHAVRGQATIKVYVIFQILEVFDRLLAGVSRDILETLFAEISGVPQGWEGTPGQQWRRWRRVARYTAVAVVYMFLHAMVLFYYLVALNVTINSYDYSLLTLLLSNQFAEIKSNVFKRYEKENLFQICCGDIVERFQIGVSLALITVKNGIELASGAPAADLSHLSLPFSFAPLPLFGSLDWPALAGGAGVWLRFVAFDWWFDTLAAVLDAVGVAGWLGLGRTPRAAGSVRAAGHLVAHLVDLTAARAVLTRVLTPVVLVYASEVLADWIKHAFITKFNTVRPEVYDRYTDILCRDLVGVERPNPASTSSPATTPAAIPEKPRSPPPARPGKLRVARSLAVGDRIGLATLPLACLVIRNAVHILRMLFGSDDNPTPPPGFEGADGVAPVVPAAAFLPWLLELGLWPLLGLTAYVCLIFFKLLLGINLGQYAWKRYAGLETRRRDAEHRTRTSVSRAEAQREWGQLQKDVSHPEEDQVKRERVARITLDNIERYTLFKNRIP